MTYGLKQLTFELNHFFLLQIHVLTVCLLINLIFFTNSFPVNSPKLSPESFR